MERAKGLICLIFIFNVYLSGAFCQPDTVDLAKSVNYNDLVIKGNWDWHLSQGGAWTDLLKNRDYALDCKHVFLFEYFIRLGIANINTELDSNYTIFAHGCNCGNEYLVHKGLEDGIDINMKYKSGMTALQYAIQSNNSKNIYYILHLNPNINNINYYGESELILVSKTLDDIGIVKKLLTLGADYSIKNNWSVSALEESYYAGNKVLFYYLYDYILEKKDTCFIRKSNIIPMSIISGDTLLLKKSLPICEPNIDVKKNEKFVKVFEEFIRFYNLYNKYRDSMDRDTISLFNTIDLDIRIAEILLNYGYDLNIQDSIGQNILFKCREIPELSRFLISKNIDLNIVDNNGKTFLQYYIDELITPPVFTLNGLVDYKVKNRDYSEELETLSFYINSGAKVGKGHLNGWKYLSGVLKSHPNPYLLKYLEEGYSDYIK